MDNPLSIVITEHSKSKCSDPSLHPGVHEFHHHDFSGSPGGETNPGVWVRSKELVRLKCNSFWRHCRRSYNLLSNRYRSGLDTRTNNKSRRASRANRFHNRLDYKHYYYLALCLLTISPVFAEEPKVNNTSNPVAAATGNVTNQAVQFQNNGASSRQQYAPGVSCNGSTMTFSPFYMGNHAKPWSEKEELSGLHPTSYQLNENWGFQINFMVPLSKKSFKQCLEIGKRHEEKLRLNYELTRAIKCSELMKSGFTLRPGSKFEHMCHDIVPIKSLLPKENANNTKTNRFNFFKKR